MGGILVLLFIIGFAAYEYLKGSVIKAFALLISCIAAMVVAFAYYELLAGILIERQMLVPWAHTLSLLLLFVITLAVLQVAVSQIFKKETIDLGLWPERIGRIACGVFLGLVVSGFLLSAFALAPLPEQYPYARFESASPSFDNPSGVLFNADGLVTSWFGAMSRGSFSGEKSFSVLHPNPLNQAYLNRLYPPAVTNPRAIEVPNGTARPAPENLKDMEGNNVSAKSGSMLMIIRIGITGEAMPQADVTFTPMQLRVVCTPKDNDKPALSGNGTAVQPIGFLKSAALMKRLNMNETITITRDDLSGNVRHIDFVFEIPADCKPVLAAFKRNAIAEIGAVATAENAPPIIPFIRASDAATTVADIEPLSSAAIYGIELSTDARLLNQLSLPIAEAAKFTENQTPESISPAKVDGAQISFVRSELKIAEANAVLATSAPTADPNLTAATGTEAAPLTPASQITGQDVGKMLKVIPRYKLLSLKCNNPATGAAIDGSKLPVLVEISGKEHHSVGVIAKGEINGQTVYEFDYCAINGEDSPEAEVKLTIEDGVVAKAFPDSVWITQKAQNISEFYVLYMVPTRSNIMIASVRAGDSQAKAKFIKYEGFFVQ